MKKKGGGNNEKAYEMDRSIHPIVLKALVRRFSDKAYPPNNAQLVSEVGVIRKNLELGARLRRLCDFQGARNEKKCRDQYLRTEFFPYDIDRSALDLQVGLRQVLPDNSETKQLNPAKEDGNANHRRPA